MEQPDEAASLMEQEEFDEIINNSTHLLHPSSSLHSNHPTGPSSYTLLGPTGHSSAHSSSTIPGPTDHSSSSQYSSTCNTGPNPLLESHPMLANPNRTLHTGHSSSNFCTGPILVLVSSALPFTLVLTPTRSLTPCIVYPTLALLYSTLQLPCQLRAQPHSKKRIFAKVKTDQEMEQAEQKLSQCEDSAGLDILQRICQWRFN